VSITLPFSISHAISICLTISIAFYIGANKKGEMHRTIRRAFIQNWQRSRPLILLDE
jgi:Na+-driven multidrug efflux pump